MTEDRSGELIGPTRAPSLAVGCICPAWWSAGPPHLRRVARSRGVVAAVAGAVLVEAHVQRLVQAVLDPPVRPHNRGEPLGIELG
jgi:hypothetical protein